ncbi:HIRAN domain-containing protein [Epilithonimonas xixisoli]|uniref:HIRAN domain-containing protein n=1 Tax=Epilithonimonas xixisoli TaxID=1476462 RepID=A0A4R8IAE5_9FLAO|nr:HIRAN domain-containing protein [Epilithonimonas xixisoli]TDX87082.1 HIRAN domain-containing protein [Epilithonimonas xixisoli]
MKTEYLTNFNVAGFTYYEGASIFSKLKIGSQLKLKLEENNKYDAKAVAIYYEKSKIGFIPRTENRIFHKMLKVGLKKNLKITIQRISPNENPEKQVQVVVHLMG